MTEKRNYELPSGEGTSNVYSLATDDVEEESRKVNVEFSQPNRTKMQRAKLAKTTTPISSPKPKSQKDNLSSKWILIAIAIAVLVNLVIASVGLWITVQGNDRIFQVKSEVKDAMKNNTETQAKEMTRLENLLDNQRQRLDELSSTMATLRDDQSHRMDELAENMTRLRNEIDSLPESLKIRLIGGNSKSGRVEIYHAGEWGTICDDNANFAAGNLMCRMLGFTLATQVLGGAHYGQGSGTIWLDNLQCTGSETKLKDCTSLDWGSHDCSHGEDLSITCV